MINKLLYIDFKLTRLSLIPNNFWNLTVATSAKQLFYSVDKFVGKNWF